MAEQLATATQNAKADAAVDLIDGGAAAGTLKIYTGSQPASANDAASGTLLVTVTLSDPAYGAAASGTAALAGTPLSGTGVAGGDAGWFRIEDSDGNTVFDGAVTATGGGGELELDNVSIAVDQVVNINSLPYTQPAAQLFRVYYDDGTTYEGPPEEAPGWGVVVIPQYGGPWWGHDLAGLLDCLARPGPNIVIHGRTVSSSRWPEFIEAANQDPDFPKTDDRSLMHGWDHYCFHGSD